ncbi:hypothetical protein HELRODRAFT_183150 [Helobdella robusta]|uniref:Uncharacterized protein n=1 Tax=Helobdella robusta TaxID=6412 RepID=T1FJ77_HELRO|nr:hypothetical protein HELRODRAFT_183150 [Helobdella robusta]ESO11457.1 hypothetical protein HELRODRAFT_183150 [Helobdella robusta]
MKLLQVENAYQVAMLEIIDRMISDHLRNRFEALYNVNNMFGFLSADLNIEEFNFEIESCKHHALTVDKNYETYPELSEGEYLGICITVGVIMIVILSMVDVKLRNYKGYIMS